MTKTEKAVELFKQGFNCSQAVLSAYAKDFGLDEKLLLKIATPFGGGMGRLGRTCGAVTGAFMVLGLKYGRATLEDEQAKETTYKMVQEFTEQFEALHGSIECRELLGYDLKDPADVKIIKEKNLLSTICSNLVNDAMLILEKMIEDK